MELPTLLDTRELAVALGEDYATVLAWGKAGVIPSIRVGRRRFYNLKAVVDVLKTPRARPGYALPTREPQPCP